jgi:hypothetical protein
MSSICLAPLIREVVGRLGLPQEACALVGPAESEDLLPRILTRFTGRVQPGFWWEQLVLPHESFQVRDGRSLVPDANLPVWVVTFWGVPPEVFASTPAAIAAVFAECPLFEFFVVPKDLSWLVGENHHDYLIAVGEPVASRLRRIAG